MRRVLGFLGLGIALGGCVAPDKIKSLGADALSPKLAETMRQANAGDSTGIDPGIQEQLNRIQNQASSALASSPPPPAPAEAPVPQHTPAPAYETHEVAATQSVPTPSFGGNVGRDFSPSGMPN